MKEKIFEAVWAALCAWLTVWLLLKLNAATDLSEGIFSAFCGFIHSFGWSVRKVLFIFFFLLYWATGMNKIFGHIILIAIGVITIVFVGSIILYFGYYFLVWLAGTL